MSSTQCRAPSASFCVATGDYFAEPLGIQPLIETWNGSVWTVTPNPTQSPVVPVTLNGVDCVSPSQCTAVGTAANESTPANVTETLAEDWNGSTWSLETTPNEGANGTWFGAVSCAGASQCACRR